MLPVRQRDKNLITRVPAFWILQTIGWTGYALDRYLSSEHFFPAILIYTVVACGLSFALQQVYKILWSRSRSVLAIGLVAVSCSSTSQIHRSQHFRFFSPEARIDYHLIAVLRCGRGSNCLSLTVIEKACA